MESHASRGSRGGERMANHHPCEDDVAAGKSGMFLSADVTIVASSGWRTRLLSA